MGDHHPKPGMTSRRSTDDPNDLPPYVPRGNSRVPVGPFVFYDVKGRFFPLIANKGCLQAVCDRYLNIDPTGKHHYKPADLGTDGIVFLSTISYGELRSEQEPGWWAQQELSFAIPVVEETRDGNTVSERPLVFTPYIYVDNPWSMLTGREVYGWNKVLAWLRVMDPYGAETSLLAAASVLPTPTILEANVFTFPHMDSHFERKQVLEIDQVSGVHPANALDLAAALQKVLTDTFADQDVAKDMDKLPGVLREQSIGLVTLKQFRDAAHPRRACYKAICQSPLDVKKWTGCGALPGKYSVTIHHHTSEPLISRLGLKVIKDVTPADQPSCYPPQPDDKCRDPNCPSGDVVPGGVYEVESLPGFWVQVDAEYGLAEIIYEAGRGFGD